MRSRSLGLRFVSAVAPPPTARQNARMRWLALALGLYLAYAALAFLVQRALLYPGASRPAPEAARVPVPPGTERLRVETAVGRVDVWFLAARGSRADDPAPALLFFHGNGELADDWVGMLEPLAAEGLGVALAEYPGFGRSGGNPTEENLTAAALAARDVVAGRPEVDAERVVAVGRSLGGAVAARLATRRPTPALVLLSTFTNVPDIATRRYLLPPFLVRDRLDARHAVSEYGGPVLVLHGTEDRVVPFRHAGALVEAAGADGRLVPLPCGHNDCPPSWSGFVEELLGFLREVDVLGRSPER